MIGGEWISSSSWKTPEEVATGGVTTECMGNMASSTTESAPSSTQNAHTCVYLHK